MGMSLKDLEKTFDGFTLGGLATARTVLRRCIADHVPIEDFFDYIEKKQELFKIHIGENLEAREQAKAHAIHSSKVLRLCPECNNRLSLRPVRRPTGKQNRHGYRSCWECPVCAWEEYSKRTFRAEIKFKAGY